MKYVASINEFKISGESVGLILNCLFVLFMLCFI